MGTENFSPPNLQENKETELSTILLEVKNESIQAPPGYKRLVKNVLKKALFTTLSAAVLSIGVEVAKRQVAEREYEKAKNLLKEYAIENNTASYQEKYTRVAEMLGESNISFLQTPGEFENNIERNQGITNNDIETTHFSQHNLKEAAMFGIFIPIKAPGYLFVNIYAEEYKNTQKEIENLKDTRRSNEYEELNSILDISDDVDSTSINEENKLVFENYRFEGPRYDTLTIPQLQKIIEQTYPKGWFSTEVEKMILTNDTTGSAMNSAYNITGSEAAHFNSASKEILLRNYELQDPNFAFEAISHESGHANDWETVEGLTPIERLDLLFEVSNRVYAPNRFQSAYVDLIKNDDKQIELYTKTKEYWAEICGEYLAFGKKNLAPKDVELVEFLIKKKDPTFNIDSAIEKRIEVMQSEVYKKPKLAPEQAQELSELVNMEAVDKQYDSLFWAIILSGQDELDSVAQKHGYRNILDLLNSADDTSKNMDDLVLDNNEVYREFAKICALGKQSSEKERIALEAYNKRWSTSLRIIDINQLYSDERSKQASDIRFSMYSY